MYFLTAIKVRTIDERRGTTSPRWMMCRVNCHARGKVTRFEFVSAKRRGVRYECDTAKTGFSLGRRSGTEARRIPACIDALNAPHRFTSLKIKQLIAVLEPPARGVIA